jgi:tetratricopeptide (TPR) repeat protein
MKTAIFTIIFLLNSGFAFAKPSLDAKTLAKQNDNDLGIFRVQSEIDAMQSAIDRDPGNVQKYVPLIQFYYQSQIWDKAEEVLKEAIDSCTNDQGIDLNGWLADDLLNLKKWDEARGYLDTALKKYPDEPMLYYDLGVDRFFKGNYAAAGKLMKMIALKDKGTQDTYYGLYDQIMNTAKEDDPGLLQMAKAALDQEPDNFKTHRLYAAAIRNAHAKDLDKYLPEILDQLNTALKLNGQYALTYITIADTYLMLAKNHNDPKQYKTALEWLDKAKAVNDPTYKKMDYEYANIYLEMSQYDKAVEYAERFHKNFPDDAGGVEMLGIAYNDFAYDDYQKGKDLQQGIIMIDKALKLDPDNGMYMSSKAELLYKLKKYQEAYKLILQAHAQLPNEDEISQDKDMIEKMLKEGQK